MTISYDITVGNNFNGYMTSWRLKMNNMFNTILNSFTIFNVFQKIITVILFFCSVLIDGLIYSYKI